MRNYLCDEDLLKCRCARSLHISLSPSGYVIFNYLTNRSFECNNNGLAILIAAWNWITLNELLVAVSQLGDFQKSYIEELLQLFELTALVVQDDAVGCADVEFEDGWEWGGISAALHFSTRDNLTVSDHIAVKVQNERVKGQPSPPLCISHEDAVGKLKLKSFSLDDPLHALMRCRRSIRAFRKQSLSLDVLSDILYAGMGITGVISTSAGDLPMKMTPSPGARNPYEVYFYSAQVSSLEQENFYHYSGFDHSIVAVPPVDDMPTIDDMFARNQPWVSGASVVIILMAYFERVMWKYLDSNAYKAVLIEAGHIAQNMMLVANKNGLVANPAGAVAHSDIERCLHVQGPTHSVVYALALGYPDNNCADVEWLAPELALRTQLLKLHSCGE